MNREAARTLDRVVGIGEEAGLEDFADAFDTAEEGTLEQADQDAEHDGAGRPCEAQEHGNQHREQVGVRAGAARADAPTGLSAPSTHPQLGWAFQGS